MSNPLIVISQRTRAFVIQRSYQVKRDDVWLPVDKMVELTQSDLVKVNIDLVVPADRNMVVLTDPVPAGLEILNDLFATTSQEDIEDAHKDDRPLYSYYFYHQAIRNDSMNYYAEWLPAGEYKLSYLTQVIAQGEFTALPPRIEEMYQPENYGTGSSVKILVKQ